MHNHGNCERCDAQNAEIAALHEAGRELATALDTVEGDLRYSPPIRCSACTVGGMCNALPSCVIRIENHRDALEKTTAALAHPQVQAWLAP